MKTGFLTSILTIIAVLSAFVLMSTGVFAHDSRNISEYRLTVGFLAEPAFEGQKNGVDFRVAHVHKDGDKEVLEPVEGLQDTVQVEVTHVPSGASRVFKLRTIFRDPGHYTSDLLLTAPGHYRMRFFGTIEGTSVNETFNSRSGGGSFNDVESSANIQFPVRLPEAREFEAATRGALDNAQTARDEVGDAKDSASSARTLAFVGIGLGVLGIAFGASSRMSGRKR